MKLSRVFQYLYKYNRAYSVTGHKIFSFYKKRAIMLKNECEAIFMFKWFDNHPVKSIILYTIMVGGSVFAFSKFILIENVEREKNAQLETKDAIILQYESKINYLETENRGLQTEIEQYLEWLQNTPGTLQYVESENRELRDEIKDLKEQIPDDVSKTEDKLYRKDYESIKANTSVIDEETNVVITMNDIDYDYKGTLSISIPQKDQMVLKDVKAGYVQKFPVKRKLYELVITNVDYISNTYSFVIRQTK